MTNPTNELATRCGPFSQILEALAEVQPTAVSVTLLVEHRPFSKRCITLKWFPHAAPEDPKLQVPWAETIHMWTEYEEGVYDDRLPHEVLSKTILTVDARIQQLKQALPAIAIEVIAGDGEDGALTAIDFQQRVQTARDQGYEPFPMA